MINVSFTDTDESAESVGAVAQIVWVPANSTTATIVTGMQRIPLADATAFNTYHFSASPVTFNATTRGRFQIYVASLYAVLPATAPTARIYGASSLTAQVVH